jgi:hypothetical protein
MKEIGRNDLCHCGSGKKYKKCCLEKDKERVLKEEVENTAFAFKENRVDYDYDDYDEDNGFYNDDDYFHGAEDEWNSIRKKPYPVISDEDEKLVDDWWDVYKTLNSPTKEREHLYKFMDSRPDLVENLGLEHEVIFELGAGYLREGKTDDHIPVLLRLKTEFPDVYIRSAGYYDSDMIAWLISKKRSGEINNYLNYFKDYPVAYIDQLADTVELMAATDHTEFLPSFLSAIGEKLTTSNDVCNIFPILFPMAINIMGQHLNTATATDIDRLIEDLKTNMPYKIDELVAKEFWKQKIERIRRSFERWTEDVFNDKAAMKVQCRDMSENFMRYLHETKGISWISAHHYSQLMLEFLRELLRRTNYGQRISIDSTKTMLDKVITLITKGYAFRDSLKLTCIINAIYYFAAYLEVCGNIDEVSRKDAQLRCFNLNKKCYPFFNQTFIESLCFKEFPLWG